MITPAELIAAFFLDIAIGDPRWLPHPVRMIGRAVCFLENRIRSFFGKGREQYAGALLVLLIVLPAGALAFFVQKALLIPARGVLMAAATVVLVYLVATTIALHELVASSSVVIRSVKAGDLPAARSGLAMIVGRDTAGLNEDAVLRAVIETVAENLSDGVIAPLLYLVFGGLPLAIAYKAINTLDSMIGYRNEKYILFGRAAARLDDAANFIPARITGLLIVIASFFYFLAVQPAGAWSSARRSLAVMLRDGRNHTSPNSGMPEAAMAGALGVRLGGPSTYGGTPVEKPFIGDGPGGGYRDAAGRAVSIIILASVAAMGTGVFLLHLRGA